MLFLQLFDRNMGDGSAKSACVGLNTLQCATMCLTVRHMLQLLCPGTCCLQATGLRLLRLAHGSAVRFGGLLRMVGDQTLKSCDPDEGESCLTNLPGLLKLLHFIREGGCDARMPTVHVLARLHLFLPTNDLL